MAMRLDYIQIAPEAYRALGRIEYYLKHCGLEIPLLELVKIRASQINGCAYCIEKHARAARTAGESEQRLLLLSAWRMAPCYTERERVALEWTEVLTLIASHPVSDELYQRVKSQFTDEELVNLTFAITTINAWNRLFLSFRTEIGTE